MDGSFPRGLKRWRVTDRGEGLIHSFNKEAGPRLLGPHCDDTFDHRFEHYIYSKSFKNKIYVFIYFKKYVYI